VNRQEEKWAIFLENEHWDNLDELAKIIVSQIGNGMEE
jgi:hypothetical protein